VQGTCREPVHRCIPWSTLPCRRLCRRRCVVLRHPRQRRRRPLHPQLQRARQRRTLTALSFTPATTRTTPTRWCTTAAALSVNRGMLVRAGAATGAAGQRTAASASRASRWTIRRQRRLLLHLHLPRRPARVRVTRAARSTRLGSRLRDRLVDARELCVAWLLGCLVAWLLGCLVR
jgi:hypothetical protein